MMLYIRTHYLMFVPLFKYLSHLGFSRTLRNSMLIRIEDTWSKASPNMGRLGNPALTVDFEGRSGKVDGYKTWKCNLAELSGQSREFEMEVFRIQGKKLNTII